MEAKDVQMKTQFFKNFNKVKLEAEEEEKLRVSAIAKPKDIE